MSKFYTMLLLALSFSTLKPMGGINDLDLMAESAETKEKKETKQVQELLNILEVNEPVEVIAKFNVLEEMNFNDYAKQGIFKLKSFVNSFLGNIENSIMYDEIISNLKPKLFCLAIYDNNINCTISTDDDVRNRFVDGIYNVSYSLSKNNILYTSDNGLNACLENNRDKHDNFNQKMHVNIKTDKDFDTFDSDVIYICTNHSQVHIQKNNKIIKTIDYEDKDLIAIKDNILAIGKSNGEVIVYKINEKLFKDVKKSQKNNQITEKLSDDKNDSFVLDVDKKTICEEDAEIIESGLVVETHSEDKLSFDKFEFDSKVTLPTKNFAKKVKLYIKVQYKSGKTVLLMSDFFEVESGCTYSISVPSYVNDKAVFPISYELSGNFCIKKS